MRFKIFASFTLLGVVFLPACSVFQSEQVRSQKRYERYVKQSMKTRDKQQSDIRKAQEAQTTQAAQTQEPQVASPPSISVTTQ